LRYMHSKGVIHCDLKPGNTMLLHPFSLAKAEDGSAPPHVLVADFGLSEIFQDDEDQGKVKGSPSYLAPEGFEGKLGEKSDMWSLGVMIYEMLTGQRPFKGTSNLFTLMCQVQNWEPPMDGISEEPRELVVALMEKDPKARPSARESHDFRWFSKQPRPSSPSIGVIQDKSGVPRLRRAGTGMSKDVGILQGLGLSSYFHSIVMFCVAAGVGMKDVRELFEVFRDMDLNMDGVLMLEELQEGLLRQGSRQDPGALMATLDMDQDGQVSYTEFLSGFLSLEPERLDNALRYAFEVFDLDEDGHLDMRELRIMLSGEGTLADVLPDGKTVEQVMEEISGGEGRISFCDFKSYLERTHCAPSPGNSRDNLELRQAPSGSKDEMAVRLSNASAEEWVRDLLVARTGSKVALAMGLCEEGFESCKGEKEFPKFHDWMSDLYLDTQETASMNKLLQFPKWDDEVTYVGYFLPGTCQQLSLLCATLVGYSCWALFTEGYKWNPMLKNWDLNVHIAINLAWLWLGATGTLNILACMTVAWHREALHKIGAVTFERLFCAWACAVPWVSCFFANRYRVSRVFGRDPVDVFESMNSDYDLIVVMLGALMFLSTRTQVRFALTLPIAVSSAAAYAMSSAMLGTPYTDYYTDYHEGAQRNWAWPAVLLVLCSVLCLSGHRSVERQQRLTFLSLQASYNVLKEINAEPTGKPEPAVRVSVAETRTARLKQAVDTTRRLFSSSELASKPMKKALESLVTVLEATREDLAHADRFLMVDVREVLADHGISGMAEDLLLSLLDAPHRIKEGLGESIDAWTSTQATGYASMTSNGSPMGQKHREDLWGSGPGWDVLAGGAGSVASGGGTGSLRKALEELLVPAVAAAVTSLWSGAKADRSTIGRVHSATGKLIDSLFAGYAAGPPAAEARATLAVRSAHWMARSLGLWPKLPHLDRVALLVAAAGLHCADAEGRGEGGALLTPYPLLGAAASVWQTLAAVEASGLAGIGRSSHQLKHSVRALMTRARPRCALEDARRVRVACDQDDEAAWAERQTLASLVVAASDFAFLALPSGAHRRWAEVCHHEACEVVAGRAPPPLGVSLTATAHQSVAGEAGDVGGAVSGEPDMYELDAGSWMRGLIQALALPLYETLATLDQSLSAEVSMATPVGHLRKNAKHWKVTSLVATAPRRDTPMASPTGTSDAIAGEITASLARRSRHMTHNEEDVLRAAAACGSTLLPREPRRAEGSSGSKDSVTTTALPSTDVSPSEGLGGTAPLERAAVAAATLLGDDIAEALALSDVPLPPTPMPGTLMLNAAVFAPAAEGIISAEEGAADLLMGELLGHTLERSMLMTRQGTVLGLEESFVRTLSGTRPCDLLDATLPREAALEAVVDGRYGLEQGSETWPPDAAQALPGMVEEGAGTINPNATVNLATTIKTLRSDAGWH